MEAATIAGRTLLVEKLLRIPAREGELLRELAEELDDLCNVVVVFVVLRSWLGIK